jgi:phage FluMu protein Com
MAGEIIMQTIYATYQGSGYYRVFCPACGEAHYFYTGMQTWKNQKCWYCDKVMNANKMKIREY